MSEYVSVERRGPVQIVRMNRPEKKNAITRAMYAAMANALNESDADPSVRVRVLLGVPGAFTAGNGEIGSPGLTVTPPAPALTATTPVFPVQAAGTVGPGQWVTIANDGDAGATISGVRIRRGTRRRVRRGRFKRSAQYTRWTRL